MSKRERFRLSDPVREKRIFLSRIRIVRLFVLVAFIVLAGRVMYLQVFTHEKFASRSENNRVQLQAIAPQRGQIRDYQGRILATNKRVQSVFFSPALAKDGKVDDSQIIDRIGKILRLPETSMDELQQRLSLRGKQNQSILIQDNISDNDYARLMVRRHQLPGLVIRGVNSRYYPYGEMMTHAVGYLGLITENDLTDPIYNQHNYQATQRIGKNGIERHYESLLHGTVGWQKVEVDARGRVHRVLDQQQPIHGSELRLGLDAELQHFAWQKMRGKRGAIVAIEPGSGRIMVLISAPAVDPNVMIRGIETSNYQQLVATRSRPFFNRYARGRYPPASTIKPVYALAGLETGVIRPDTKVYDPGYFQLKDNDLKYRNWLRRGHGQVDLKRAMRVSNDTYFFNLAEQLGYTQIAQSLDSFGFGHKVSLDVFGESPVYVPSPQWKFIRFSKPWVTGDNINMGIGQGYLLSTPLQLAAMTSVLANRGKWVRPRLLFGINNKRIHNWQNAENFDDVQAQEEHWQAVIDAMVSSTSNPEGTSYRAARASEHTIAGKTGTAQVINLSRDDEEEKEYTEYTKDHALFIGFAPAEKPKIAIAVVLENGGSGGSDAAPIAVAVINRFLDNTLELTSNE